jgi:hypothetical protein
LSEFEHSEQVLKTKIRELEEESRLYDGAAVLLDALQTGKLVPRLNSETLDPNSWAGARIENGMIQPRPSRELTFNRGDILAMRPGWYDDPDELHDGMCNRLKDLEWSRRQNESNESVQLRSLAEAALTLTEARKILSGEPLATGSANDLGNEAYRWVAVSIEAGSLRGAAELHMDGRPPSNLDSKRLRALIPRASAAEWLASLPPVAPKTELRERLIAKVCGSYIV